VCALFCGYVYRFLLDVMFGELGVCTAARSWNELFAHAATFKSLSKTNDIANMYVLHANKPTQLMWYWTHLVHTNAVGIYSAYECNRDRFRCMPTNQYLIICTKREEK
jgi:hypothetical protein